MTDRPHVAIVGAYGSAGVAVASELADEDVEVTLIDDGDPGGGLCILRGCMPSKEVISAGAHRFQARHDHRLGDPPSVDLPEVVATKDEHVSDFAAHRRAAVADLADRENVAFYHDTARFVDDHTLAVGDRRVEADYVVVATGSTVNVPDLPGIDEVPYRTSADVLDATEFPESGIVMGFGYVGLEMVPYIAEAGGTELTVIEHDARPIDEADPDYGDAALEIYEDAFDVEVLTHTYEQRLEPTEDGGVRLHTDRDDEYATVEAEELFLFNGREPILHVAKEQGFQAAENVLAHHRGEALEPYENVHHHVVFSGLGVYPYARVGHSVETAEEAGLEYVAVSREASDDGVFRTKDVPEGLATLVVGTDGTVLGYQGLHYHADVMAKTMQLAVEMGLDVREIPDRAYHPTTPEILDGLVRAAADQV